MRIRSNDPGMNEGWPAVLAAVINRPLHYRQRFYWIGAVASLAIQIGETRDEFRGIAARSLDLHRNADRIAVIFQQEHDRQTQVACSVERFPKLSFAGGPIA